MKGLAEAIQAIKSRREDSLPQASASYSLASGRMVGGVPEREIRLEAQGSGQVTLFRRRPSADTPALPPGLFRGEVSPEEFLRFLETLDKSGIENFRAEPPSPRDLQRRLQVVADGRFFSFQWGPMPPDAPDAITDLLAILSKWEASACPEPVWSLGMKIIPMAEGVGDRRSLKARLQIENKGTETIHLAHPASRTDRGLIALTLRYGSKPPDEPGVTPLPLTLKLARVDLPQQDPLRLVPIKSGSPFTFDVEAPLEPIPAGEVALGMFALELYLASDNLAGLPVFNGAIFSEEFSW